MASVFCLPDLGEGLREAEIVAWQVGVGDHVVADQPLVSVETDKAVVEIPSPRAGRIAALHGAPGDVVEVGAILVEFESAPAADAGAIVGDLPAAVTGGDRAAPGVPAPVPRSVAAAAVRAAPAVRRRAAERGVDLAALTGSGPEGAITMGDVEAAGTTGAVAARPRETEPLRGVRRAMHLNMTRAGREVVRATVTGEADIDAWPGGTDTTVRLIRAVVRGCAAEPSLNAWFDADAGTRVLHRQVDLGIAFDVGEGLFVPVLRDAGRHSADELRHLLEALKGDVARRAVARESLTGQTITLSNFGTHGGRFAELVVMPPQVAILGAGRAEARCVAVGGVPAVRRVLPLSLSFDHRVVTGGEATRFLNAAIADLGLP